MSTSTSPSATGAPAFDDPADDEIQPALPGRIGRGRFARDPRRRSRWWLEALVIVWLLWVYDAITNLAALREHAAMAHGLAVLRLEVDLHLDPERALNHWLQHHHLLGLLAGDYYDNIHFVVTLAVVGWLWWRHPRHYRPLRTAIVLVNVIGFVVYWQYPVAPPRLLGGEHFFDTVALSHALGGWHSGALSKAANQFAAMPSLHLAWAAWSALAVWMVVRGRRGAVLVWIYPILTTVDVMATANHFLLDCVAGSATVAVAALVALRIHRALDARRSGTDGSPPQRAARSSAPTGVVNTPRVGKTAHTTNAPA